MMRRVFDGRIRLFARRAATPLALGVCAALLAALASFTALATQFDNNLYDFLFRLTQTPAASSPAVLVGLDERTFRQYGGTRALRSTLADLLARISTAKPAVVAIDLTLTDPGDPAEDARLAAAMSHTPRLVLACEMTSDGSAWQRPVPMFASHAAACGHVSTLAGPYDNVNRRITLERVSERARLWALSLEALRLYRGAPDILSSPTDLTLAGLTIESRWDEGRPLRVRYSEGAIPMLSAADLLEGKRLAELSGRVVFVGITATSAVPDRLFTPLSRSVPMPGVEIHAQAFDTMQSGHFLTDQPLSHSLLLAAVLSVAIALALGLMPGWAAWLVAVLLVSLAHAAPVLALKHGQVLAPFAPAAAAWIALLACAAHRYFFVYRRLDASQAATERYQQAFHFVAHEMRTPLTAIQGSSELMTRYNLPDPKRRELGLMINAESKRLAKMITTFLDVEKLSAGQMELRRSVFPVPELIDMCYQRAMPLAERKQIRVTADAPDALMLDADRELMEYALYNLLTNAIKYSPPESDITVRAWNEAAEVRLSVRDQGMGMDATEVKNLFRKFYRTRSAERSGEVGTGIGLSIVQQIILHHGGRISVESAPGKGSTFTVALPATLH
jgi:signal transduction histidine kinase